MAKEAKEAQKHREAYEKSVTDACQVCNEAMEAARSTFLEAKRTALHRKLEAIQQAREAYEKVK